jgi:hypothetical protein
MLDKEVIKEFLDGELKNWDTEILGYIPREALVEAFCQYAEELSGVEGED